MSSQAFLAKQNKCPFMKQKTYILLCLKVVKVIFLIEHIQESSVQFSGESHTPPQDSLLGRNREAGHVPPIRMKSANQLVGLVVDRLILVSRPIPMVFPELRQK